MTIVLPKSYGAVAAIRQRSIPCITEEQALREDIRALRIGLLNLKACDEDYEASLLGPMGRSVMQIEPSWIRLKNHAYDQREVARVNGLYVSFEQAIETGTLDGLIVSGVSGREVDFENLPSWPEVARILRYARNNIPATLGIGWGAQMLASFIGAGSRLLGQKQFGVYEARNLDEVHRITSAMDDVFCCPVSRWSAVDDDALEREQKQGAIELLARSDQAGYLMAESSDHRFLMHFGHPEYEVADMVREYRHANGENGGGGSVPENFDETKTVNCWRGHCTALFTGWIRYIHETRTF